MNVWDWNYVAQILPDLLQASLKTLGITVAGFLIAVVLGLFLAVARRSRQAWLSWPVALLIEFIRSTPLLIQVYFLYYVLPNYGVNMSAMQAGTDDAGLHGAHVDAVIGQHVVEEVHLDQQRRAANELDQQCHRP